MGEVSARAQGGSCEAQSFPSRNYGVGGAGGRHVGLECSMAIDGSTTPWVAHASEEEPWFRVKFSSNVRLHRMVWHPFGDATATSPQMPGNSITVNAIHHPWRIQLEFDDGSIQIIQLDNATLTKPSLYKL